MWSNIRYHNIQTFIDVAITVTIYLLYDLEKNYAVITMVWFYCLNDLEGQAQSAAILITKTGRVPRYMPGENLKSVLMHICVNLRDSIPNLPYHINKLKLHTFFDKLFIQTRKWSFIHPIFLSAAVRWMDCTHPTPTTTPNPHHPPPPPPTTTPNPHHPPPPPTHPHPHPHPTPTQTQTHTPHTHTKHKQNGSIATHRHNLAILCQICDELWYYWQTDEQTGGSGLRQCPICPNKRWVKIY